MQLNNLRQYWAAMVLLVGPIGAGRMTTLECLERRTRHLKPPPRWSQILTTPPMEVSFHIDLAKQDGWNVECHFYLEGSRSDPANHRRLLAMADIVWFVGDSTRPKESADTLRDLRAEPAARGAAWILQYNKRDLAGAVPVAELDALLKRGDLPMLETVATRQEGFDRALELIDGIVRARIAAHPGNGPGAPRMGGAEA